MKSMSLRRRLSILIVSFYSVYVSSKSLRLRCTVFGASGGVGQLATQQLLNRDVEVFAVTRDIAKASKYEALRGSKFVEANALRMETLPPAIEGADFMIINVGTTAFPTSKWEGMDVNNPKTRPKNAPQIACFDTVDNIMKAMSLCRKKPKKVVLISSIGVERSDEFPFKILNLYGVLDAKRESEDLLISRCKEMGTKAIVVRPGRLVGAPFTNFDLARLIGKKQDSGMRGIEINKGDVLAGDIEREDVATAIVKVLLDFDVKQSTKFSIINTKGEKLSEQDFSYVFTASQLFS